jgi:hypothetical protein
VLDFAANRFQKLRSVAKIWEIEPNLTPWDTGRGQEFQRFGLWIAGLGLLPRPLNAEHAREVFQE